MASRTLMACSLLRGLTWFHFSFCCACVVWMHMGMNVHMCVEMCDIRHPCYHLPPSLLIQGFSHESGSLIRLVTLLQGSSAFNSRVLETQTLVLMLVEKVLRPLSRFPGPWPHLLIPLFQCEFWSNHTNHSNSQIIADSFALHFCMVWIACLYMSHHRSPANPLWQVLKILCWMTH